MVFIICISVFAFIIFVFLCCLFYDNITYSKFINEFLIDKDYYENVLPKILDSYENHNNLLEYAEKIRILNLKLAYRKAEFSMWWKFYYNRFDKLDYIKYDAYLSNNRD